MSVKNGTERTFYPNGQIEGEVTYINGRLNGVTKHWHPNGVLASEIPVKNDIVEGVARFWNEKGELLGSCEIRNGTGIEKLWFENGNLMGETSWVNGQWTGRQIAYFEDGSFCAETYYIRNQKVSKKKYLEACKADPSLPRYDIDRPRDAEPSKSSETPPSVPQSRDDQILERLLNAAASKEALEWLKAGKSDTRTLGELPTTEASIELADEIYSLGVERVTAVEIQIYESGEQNTGKLILTLPNDPAARTTFFAWYAERSAELGFEPEKDIGQRNVMLMLD